MSPATIIPACYFAGFVLVAAVDLAEMLLFSVVQPDRVDWRLSHLIGLAAGAGAAAGAFAV